VRTGQNVIWRAHLECEPTGRQYELRGPNSKVPPVVAGDRIFVLGEPHFLICLDKMTGKKLWERECNILEFTAPDKVEESRRIWAEHVAARTHLFELDRDWDARRESYKKQNKRLHPAAQFNGWAEWVEVLTERGMSADEAKKEIERRIAAMNEKCFDFKRRKGEYETFLTAHAKYGGSGWGSWTGYSFGSPVTDGTKVWVKFCTGVAACFDRDGNRLWMSRIPAEFNNYPVCISPLLTDGKFIVEVGAGSGGLAQGYEYTMLVALDAASGKELWRSDRILQYSATGSSVAMLATNGKDDVPAIVTGGGAVVRASDGAVLFRDWKTDAGSGTPTLHGWDLYYPSYDCVLAACRLTMHDRDSIGLRRLWTRPTPCEFDGGMIYDNGILYGPGGGQRALGYVVFDAAGRKLLRHETYGTPRQGVPPWVNGRQYVPAIAAGDYLYLGEHGTLFDGPSHDGSVCAVMQKGADGFLIAQNETEETWTAPPVVDGDRIYIRTDPSLICVGYTGNDGKAYEADVNARYILPELEVQPPGETPPIEIAPTKWRFSRGGSTYSQSIAYPMTVIGPFSHMNSDAVLKAIGVENASAGVCREPEKPQALGARLPVNVAGETINGSWHESCFYENHSTARLKGLVGKGAFFSTALNNDRERVVRVWAQQEPPDIWINGQPVPEGARVRLKPGVYALLARWATTEEHPAPPGFHFRLDDSSDVATERKAWQESLRRCKPELDRIANYATRPAAVEKAKKLLAAIEK
jgi:outer membrane protein assembly factor BamB